MGVEDYCVCLLERQTAGYSIFPGGQVHSIDYAIADGQAVDKTNSASLALRVAAMREVFAETGVVLADPAPPYFLREATREVLLRDGPRTLLDCMIAWDGGNPFPRFTLCPLETHFLLSEIPDAQEL